jgi:hypothetical protein
MVLGSTVLLRSLAKLLFFLDFLTPEDGIDTLSRNVGDYHSKLRNIPEECGSYQHFGGSLKSSLYVVDS